MQAIRSEARTTSPAAEARKVLDQHWNGLLPVDPVAIAMQMGLRVVAMGRGGQPWEYSGYFRSYDPTYDGPVIQVNATDAAVRQRFTVAHELGHYVLRHNHAPRDVPAKYNVSVSDPIERAANQFAAELLMPAAALRKIVQSGRMTSIDELANAFQVSQVAMDYRLSNLNLR